MLLIGHQHITALYISQYPCPTRALAETSFCIQLLYIASVYSFRIQLLSVARCAYCVSGCLQRARLNCGAFRIAQQKKLNLTKTIRKVPIDGKLQR